MIKKYAIADYTTAEEIKNVRKELNMTQKEFAEYTFTSLNTLQHWEHNDRRVPENFMRLVAYKLLMDKNAKDYSKDIDEATQDKKN